MWSLLHATTTRVVPDKHTIHSSRTEQNKNTRTKQIIQIIIIIIYGTIIKGYGFTEMFSAVKIGNQIIIDGHPTPTSPRGGHLQTHS